MQPDTCNTQPVCCPYVVDKEHGLARQAIRSEKPWTQCDVFRMSACEVGERRLWATTDSESQTAIGPWAGVRAKQCSNHILLIVVTAANQLSGCVYLSAQTADNAQLSTSSAFNGWSESHQARRAECRRPNCECLASCE